MSDKLQEIKASVQAKRRLQELKSNLYGTVEVLMMSEIEWLIDQLEQERKQKENCILAYNDMETRYNNLKIANGALQSHSSGDYIAWIHGEENHLESLSCNVMIHADDLRSLVNEQLEQAQQVNLELERDIEEIRDERDELHGKLLDREERLGQSYWAREGLIKRLTEQNQKLIEALADIRDQTRDEESQYIAAKTLQEVQHGTSKET